MSLIIEKQCIALLQSFQPKLDVFDLEKCFQYRGAILKESKQVDGRRHYWFTATTAAGQKLKVFFVYSSVGNHLATGICNSTAIDDKIVALEITDINQALELVEQFFSAAEHCVQILRRVAGLKNDHEINRDLTSALSNTNVALCRAYEICDGPMIRKHIEVRMSYLEKFEEDLRKEYEDALRARKRRTIASEEL